MADRDFLTHLSRKLTDEGKLMEAGWIGLRLAAIPDNAPKTQLEEMRMAFFAGAQHLYASIMTIMDEDREPTADDLRRMEFIDAELKAYVRTLTGEQVQ